MGNKIDPNQDYTLDKSDSVWITVGNLSVKVKHEDEGAVVDIYALGSEDEGYPIGSTYVFFNEAENE